MTLDKEEVEEEEDVEEKEDDDAEEEVEDHQGRRREEGEVSLETRTKTITWKRTRTTWKRTRPSVGTSFVLRCRAWLLNKQGPAGQRLVLGQWAFYADSEHKAH